MTLVIGLVNSQQTVLLSDRRLTAGGRTVEDESNKTAVIALPRARLVTGYTGLGEIGTIPNRFGPPPEGAFRTPWWLLEEIRNAGPPDFTADGVAKRFATLATQKCSALPGHPSPEARRLAVMFVGYDYTTGQTAPFLRTVHNFGRRDAAARDTFSVWEGAGDRSFMTAIGAFQVLDLPAVQPEAQRLRELAESHRPATALVGKGVEVMRLAAAQPEAAGTIGGNILSVVVPADPTQMMQAQYHADHPSAATFFPDVVNMTRPDQTVLMGGMQLRSGLRDGPPGPPIVYPRVGRDAPCPGGSGQKYKRCHGKSQGA